MSLGPPIRRGADERESPPEWVPAGTSGIERNTRTGQLRTNLPTPRAIGERNTRPVPTVSDVDIIEAELLRWRNLPANTPDGAPEGAYWMPGPGGMPELMSKDGKRIPTLWDTALGRQVLVESPLP